MYQVVPPSDSDTGGSQTIITEIIIDRSPEGITERSYSIYLYLKLLCLKLGHCYVQCN